MFRTFRVAGTRVGVVHGDPDSLAGWSFAVEAMEPGDAALRAALGCEEDPGFRPTREAEAASFFDASDDNAPPGAGAARAGAQFEHAESWGEKYAGVGDPALFVCDFASRGVARVAGVPAGVTPGQALSIGASLLGGGSSRAPGR